MLKVEGSNPGGGVFFRVLIPISEQNHMFVHGLECVCMQPPFSVNGSDRSQGVIAREMDGSNLSNVVFQKEFMNKSKLFGMTKSLEPKLSKSSTPSDGREPSKYQSQEAKTHTKKNLFTQ